ncbi:MAG: glycosyltransferase 87 family protein [Gordonia sp. (in: high G+C Gram-positive bacteria)]|uniref:glycosyltransferase 87 family protein n=1 Tax=Gordonia sp. (in: high G+C Gram-positive bacteria) TaxID=84139 RepID=UPI003BB640E1
MTIPQAVRPWFTAAVLSIVATLLVVPYEAVVQHVPPVDFYVYRYAAQAAYDGANLYDANVFGPGIGPSGLPFTYSPFAAVVLWPATLFGAQTAYQLWSIASLLALAYVLNKYLPGPWPLRLLRLVAALVIARFTVVLYHHLSFGQINLLLMALCVADVFGDRDSRLGRALPRGVLIGVAGAIKFTPMLFLLFFLAARRWRDAAWTMAGFVGATIVGFAVFPASSTTFFTDTFWHLSDKVDLGAFFATSGNNSLTGAFAALGPAWRTVGTVLALVAALTGLWLACRVDRRLGLGPAALVVGLTAAMVSPVSWIHHWVYLLPALVYLAGYGGTAARWFAGAATAFLVVTQGPTTGDNLLATDNPWLLLPGLAARESLILLGAAVITFLATLPPRDPLPPRRPDSRLRVATLYDSRDPPSGGDIQRGARHAGEDDGYSA